MRLCGEFDSEKSPRLWCELQPEIPPRLHDIPLDLRLQGLEGHETAFLADLVQELDLHMAAVDVAAEVEQVFREFVAKKEVIKEDKEILTPELENDKSSARSLNEKLVREIKVDLNDRLAFVKHLFRESTEDFNRVISQLNTIDTEERSRAFIENMIKPEYDNWKGKENYENRFLALIERRFA